MSSSMTRAARSSPWAASSASCRRNLSRRDRLEHASRCAADEAELIAILRKADDWDRAPTTAAGHGRLRGSASAPRAARRTAAGHQGVVEGGVRGAGGAGPRIAACTSDWMYHGFDGAMALRSLILLTRPERGGRWPASTLWRDDPALEPVVDPRWKNPRSWTDFRVKMVIFPALEKCPGAATEKLCRDYLALSDDEAREARPAAVRAGRARRCWRSAPRPRQRWN